MKKVMIFALCMAAMGSASAQKANVDAAKKLSGNLEKISEARDLIGKAIQDPSTANDAMTYYIAGKIEMDAFNNAIRANSIQPESVSDDAMLGFLTNGYNYFLKALPLDQVPDEKGKVKPRVTKDIAKILNTEGQSINQMGAQMWEAQKYFPASYTYFVTYAGMADQPELNGLVAVPEQAAAQAYFNAGLAAYTGKGVREAADAFSMARKHNYLDANGQPDPNAYVYEIACWQNLAPTSPEYEAMAAQRIYEIANAGNQVFGLSQPVFINNLVNSLVMNEKYDEALAKVNDLLAANPDNSNLYGLLGFVNDRAGKDDASVDNYLKAVAIENCDFETLKNASKKLFRVGTAKLEQIDPTDKAGKEAIKANYYDKAKAITDRAKGMNPSDSDLNYVIENLDYAIETYF
ncbi:MAG: hypothetical protein HDR80_04070 [Bacteroides sp.]|nr:hypothetical protein [Bacteroides sp.]